MSDEGAETATYLLEFLDGLPDSVSRLRPEDVQWILDAITDPDWSHTVSLRQVAWWAERLGSTTLVPPEVFALRLFDALSITFDLAVVDKILDLTDPELLKWVKMLTASRASGHKPLPAEQFRCPSQG